jgi:hypothetical protein
MSDTQPAEETLTPHARHILQHLTEIGTWANRGELAKRMQKNKLNKWDIVLLEKLVEGGLIETRKTPFHGPIGFEWQYRITSVEGSP